MPGLASAQQASPVAVLPQVIEQPQVLPRTGSTVVPMIVIALALLALGAVLVISARRRNAGDANLA